MSQPILHRSPHALRDLDDIWFYIAEDSLTNADRFLDQLKAKVLLLAQNPYLGRLRDDISQRVMRLEALPIGPITSIIKPIDGGIVLYRILHGSRDVSADLLHLDDI